MFLVLEKYLEHSHTQLVDALSPFRCEVVHRAFDPNSRDGSKRARENQAVRNEVTGAIGEVFDHANSAYLIWCNHNKTILYGCLRLSPSTGPSRMGFEFGGSVSDDQRLQSPGIWEAIDLHINFDALANEWPDMGEMRATCILLLALCEIALTNGIHTLVTAYQPSMRRIFNLAGIHMNEMCHFNEIAKTSYYVGSFPVTAEYIMKMQQRLKVEASLLKGNSDQLFGKYLRTAA